MALAETAELIVRLRLQDQLTGALRTAQGKLAATDKTMGRLTKSTQNLTRGFGGAGLAAAGLVGPLKLLAGGSLVFGVTRFLTGAVDQAGEFGRSAVDLAKVLNLPIEQASRLTDVLGDFGLESEQQLKVLGRLGKNVQALAGDTKKAAKFEQEFGFSLTDANGKIVDANELLRRSADYFNSNASASQKATVLTKLYGREWTKLIPLLSKGGDEFQRLLSEGLTLTPAQIGQLEKLREEQRKLNDAWGEAQIIIGLELVPLFTKLAEGVRTFVNENREGIRGFVSGLAAAAQEIGSAVGALAPVGKLIADAWNAIPPDFRKLLLAGFIGNKILKMTVGIDVLDFVRKSVLGITAAVVNVNGPVAGIPGVPGSGGPGNLIKQGIKFILPIAAGVLIANAIREAAGIPADQNINGENRNPYRRTPIVGPPVSEFKQYLASEKGEMSRVFGGSWAKVAPILDQLHKDFLVANGLLKTATNPAEITAAVMATVTPLLGGVGSVGTTKDVLATLKAQLAATKDPATQKVLREAIEKVERKLMTRELIAEQKATADKIVRSDLNTQTKLNKLQDIERELRERGAVKAADLINAKIESLKAHLDAIRLAIVSKSFGGTINDPTKPGSTQPKNRSSGGTSPAPISDKRGAVSRGFSPGGIPGQSITTNINVSTDHRQNSQAASVQTRYGPTPALAGSA